MLVIGVVSADLGAAGTAEQGRLGSFTRSEGVLQSLGNTDGPGTGVVQAFLCAIQGVQGSQGLVMCAAAQRLKQSGTGTHKQHLIII